MAAKSKLELILELKNKIFNNKLMQTKKKFTNSYDKMRGKIKQLKVEHSQAFRSMINEVPGASRVVDLLTNKYVLLAGVLVGLVALYANAGRSAASFNNEFLQIKNLNLDKSKQELRTYQKLISDTTFKAGTDLDKTTIAFYDVQSALGIFGEEAASVTRKVANFSVATGADLNDSINSTVKAMKAFGLETKDVDMLLASNAKTVQVGITNFEQLAKVQTEYAGAAKGAGQTVDTANKVFAAFTSIAKDSNTAATMTKTAFEGLTQKGTIEGLKRIGISLYDSNGNMRDMSKILEEVSGKFSKMTPKQIDEIINKIGGPEGLRNLFVKLKTGSEDFFKTLQAFDNSSFDLTKALKNAQGDITVLGGIVRNRWNVVLAKLGETILPLVAQVFDGLNNILTWTYANFENIKMVVIALAAGASVFVANFLLVKTIMIASSIASVGLSGSLGLVVGALRAVGLAIYSIPIIGWIAAAIGAIVLMYQKFDWFRDLIDTIGSTFKDFFKELWTRTKAVVGGIVDMFVGLARIIGGALTFDKEMISSGVDKFKKGLETQKVEVGMVAKNLNPVDYAKQGFDTYHKKQDARRHSEKIKAIAEEKAKEEAEGTTNDPLNTNNTPVGDDITTVTGAGSSVKNITYNIEAFNKGGINTSNTILNKMSAEEIEQWFTEAMLRLSRTIELGQ